MSDTFWVWAILIPSCLIYLKIVDRRLKKRGEPFHKIYNPFMVYRLDFQDYALIFIMMCVDLGLLTLLDKFGLILP